MPKKSRKKRRAPTYGLLTAATPAEHRLAYTIPDALASGAFSSRNKLYAAITTGELRTYLDGKRRMITADALRECLAKRERATAEAA